MRIVLIGAGRLSTQLAMALKENGHRVSAVFSRTMSSAEQLAHRVGAIPTNRIEDLPLAADAFIVAITDTHVESIIHQLRTGREEQLFYHTAGSVAMGHYDGVFYPLQTFSKEKKVDFSTIPVFIEFTTEKSKETITQLAQSLSKTVLLADSEKRKVIHLAAVFACNFANHCYAIAEKLLSTNDIPFETLHGLIGETTAKALVMSPRLGQTGPAVRYDTNIIGRQSKMLEQYEMFQKIYDLMSESIHQMSEQ